MKHTEIVSVTYRRGKAGERVRNDFDEWAINKPHPDDWPEDLKFYDWRGTPVVVFSEDRYGGVHLDLPTDWFGLRFEFVGQLFDDQESGLHWECDAAGAGEVFSKWADELKAIGDRLLDSELDRRRDMARRIDMWESLNDDQAPREVTFLTAWEYEGHKDWEGEYYSKWKLLGRLDLSKVETLIVQEVAA